MVQPAKRWSSIPTWTRSPSRVQRKSVARFVERPRNRTRSFLSNLAENLLSSFLKTPIWTAPSKVSLTAFGSIKAKSAAPVRLLMQESIAEKLTRKVQDRMSTLRVGSPLDKAIDVGAIVAKVQLERIDSLVKQGITEGATCWQPEIVMPSRGFYYKPTFLSNVHPTSIVAQQEIFGPVLAAMTFRTPQEAVQLANNTVYGLAASVWSESVNLALQAAAQIKAGVVWVNSTNLFDAACGFGGYRESGYGREGGREGLLEYLEPDWFRFAPALAAPKAADERPEVAHPANAIDRTVK